MSSFEYYDLFLKCQSSGQYQIITFDIVNSKLIDVCKRKQIQISMFEMANILYEHILQIEKNNNVKILVFEKDFQYLKDNNRQMGFGFKIEPFVLGDMFGFTIYRNSLSLEYIINIFNQLKENLKMDVDFHINTGYYETNEYELGQTMFFRGYCIDIVSNLHKKSYKKLIRKRKK